MGFEFIYSLCIWLVPLAGGIIGFRWLEQGDIHRIAKYAKLASSPYIFMGGFALAAVAMFGIPYAFDFKFDDYGFITGLALYAAWVALVGHSKWKSLKDRVKREKMEERGIAGARMADLRVRKLADYVPLWGLAVPYILLLALGLFVAIWVGTSPPSSANVFSLLALGVGLTLFLTTRMYGLVREPIDLRSYAPKEFIPKVHAFIKKQIRLLLVFQIVHIVSLLFLVVGFSTYLLSPIWVFAGVAPFAIYSIWFSVSTHSGLAKLDDQRWMEGVQGPANGT